MAEGLPHARGGVSCYGLDGTQILASSPRPWGCFQYRNGYQATRRVFPTPVGVFPTANMPILVQIGLPHARGGVSPLDKPADADGRSSPRPWGCFYTNNTKKIWTTVFPTPVGVFLQYKFCLSHLLRLPHARGGVSRQHNNSA